MREYKKKGYRRFLDFALIIVLYHNIIIADISHCVVFVIKIKLSIIFLCLEGLQGY